MSASKNKTILLTGATGFLGSHLLVALIASGYKVVILKRSTSSMSRINSLLSEVYSYDTDKCSLEKIFEEQCIDVVIHTACNYGRKDESLLEMVESNLMFGLRLLEFSVKYNVVSFVNVDTILGKNLNAYTLSKKQLVEWLFKMSSKIQVVNLKLEHMYGVKDDDTKFIYWVLKQLRNNEEEIKLTTGVQLRDFIYVDDVVSAFITILNKLEELNSFNEYEVGIGKSISVRNFIEKLKMTYEKKYGVSSTVLNFGAIPYRDGEVMEIIVNNKSLLDLGWSASTSLEKGLEMIIQDMQ